MQKKRILFPFVEAGFGHIMPMRAALNAFKSEYGDSFEVIDTNFFRDTKNEDLEYVEKRLIRAVKLHNTIPIYGFFQFFFLAWGGTKVSMDYVHKVMWKRGFKPAMQLLKDLQPDVILNTHFSTLYYACEAREQGLISKDCKIVCYCPDPHIGRQWDRRADLVLCSSENGVEKAKRIRKRRAFKGEVKLVPFPVQEEIKNYTKTRAEYKQELGIDANRFTILLADGAYGQGRIKKTILEFIKQFVVLNLQAPITLLAVCGKNEKLENELNQLKLPENIDLKVFGFTDKMLLLSAAADLFMGKSSASILAETSYFGVPAISTFTGTPVDRWIEGYYVNERKSVIKIYNVKRAVKKAVELSENPEQLERLASGTEGMRGNGSGASEIARYLVNE